MALLGLIVWSKATFLYMLEINWIFFSSYSSLHFISIPSKSSSALLLFVSVKSKKSSCLNSIPEFTFSWIAIIVRPAPAPTLTRSLFERNLSVNSLIPFVTTIPITLPPIEKKGPPIKPNTLPIEAPIISAPVLIYFLDLVSFSIIICFLI